MINEILNECQPFVEKYEGHLHYEGALILLAVIGGVSALVWSYYRIKDWVTGDSHSDSLLNEVEGDECAYRK